MDRNFTPSNAVALRAIASKVAKLCKMQKVVNFTHFNQKNTYICACKIVHIYKSVTVTVYICTITVALHLIFYYLLIIKKKKNYYLFLSHSLHSLFCIIERNNKKM